MLRPRFAGAFSFGGAGVERPGKKIKNFLFAPYFFIDRPPGILYNYSVYWCKLVYTPLKSSNFRVYCLKTGVFWCKSPANAYNGEFFSGTADRNLQRKG